MKKKGRTILNIVFLAAVLFLTFYTVLKGENIGDLINGMRRADPRYILGAVACILVFLLGQGLVIYLMLRAVEMKRSFKSCAMISFTGYFFCSITPFQSGGPPVQVLSMRRKGIPYAVSSIVVLITTFLFKMVLVVLGILYLLVGHFFLGKYLRGVLPVFGIGLFLTMGFTTLLAIFIFHPSLARAAIVGFFKWLEKKRILKPKEGRIARWEGFMDRYKETAGFFRAHLYLMIVLFFITCLQRFAFFLATYFVYRAFGLSGTPAVVIALLQACISISADMLPLPGGAGASEHLFIRIFRPIFGAHVLPGMMLSRGISYYVQLIFCGIMTIIWRVSLNRRGTAVQD